MTSHREDPLIGHVVKVTWTMTTGLSDGAQREGVELISHSALVVTHADWFIVVTTTKKRAIQR